LGGASAPSDGCNVEFGFEYAFIVFTVFLRVHVRREFPGGAARRNTAAHRVANGLYLAAAPTFATMALLTGVLGGGPPDVLCSTAGAVPLGGMVPMYLLMSVFHLAPWLKLIASRQGAVRSILRLLPAPR